MKLLIDTHTHTTRSGHAYSTVFENLTFAAKHGLEGIVVADHAERVPGVQPNYTFNIQKILPEEYNGVHIYKGVELNIYDYYGNVDMTELMLKNRDFAIASLHKIVLAPGSKEHNTDAMIGALQNKYVDIIGHPGNPVFPVDEESVVLAAAKNNKLIEINNHSFSFRKGSSPICRKFIRLCKKHDVRICVSSDAHICLRIGIFDDAILALQEENFPEELIVSRNLSSFREYLSERKNRIEQ